MVSQTELNRIQRIDGLKKKFYEHCGVVVTSEANRIWSRWITQSLSLWTLIDEFIPEDGGDIPDLTQCLVEQMGIDQTYVQTFVRSLTSFCNEQIERIQRQTTQSESEEAGHLAVILPTNIPEIGTTTSMSDLFWEPVKGTETPKCLISFRNWSHQVNFHIYQNLLKRYVKVDGKVDENKHDHQFDDALWKTLSNYRFLDGYGQQLSLPPETYEILKELGCNSELFSSPLNCYLKDYFSLFKSDVCFGSRGNFFDANDQYYSQGIHLVHPPDYPTILTRTAEVLLNALESSDPVIFIYIMPRTDHEGFDLLINSDKLRAQIKLEEYQHYYHDRWHQRYVRSNHRTQILILSNQPLSEGWELYRSRLITAMCQPNIDN